MAKLPVAPWEVKDGRPTPPWEASAGPASVPTTRPTAAWEVKDGRPIPPWELKDGGPTAPWGVKDGRPTPPWEYDSDLQRKASVLEKIGDVMAIPVNIGAGALSGGLSGEGVIEGIQTGLKEHKTYGDVLAERGVTNPWLRIPLGFAADVVLDPLTYTGIGALTKAGKVAKGAAVAAELAGDMAGAARFGTTMAKQASRGERAALTIFGKSVLPKEASAAILGAVEKTGELPGAKQAVDAFRKLVDPVAVKGMNPVQREAFLINLQKVEGAKNLAKKNALDILRPRVEKVREVVKALGRNPDDIERLIFSAAETPIRSVDAKTPVEVGKWLSEPEKSSLRRYHWLAVSRDAESGLGNISKDMVESIRRWGGVGDMPSSLKGSLRKFSGRTDLSEAAVAKLKGWDEVGSLTDDLAARLSEKELNLVRKLEGKATKLAMADDAAKALVENSKMKKLALNAAPAELRDEVKGLIDDARNLIDTDLVAQQAQGIKVPLISEMAYVPHIATESMTNAARKSGQGQYAAGRAITEQSSDLLQREFREAGTDRLLSRNEANDIMRITGTSATGGVASEGFMGLASATAESHIRRAKAIKSAEILNDYSRNYGKRWTSAAEKKALEDKGWKAVANDLEHIGDKVYFPPEIAEALGTINQGIFNPKGRLGDALRGFDALTNGWKAITLGLFPSFHTRNEFDDLFRATAYGGMNPFKSIPAAIAIQTWGTKLFKQGTPESFEFAGKKYASSELQELALKNGVTDTGQVGELGERLDLAKKSKNPITWMTDLGHKVGTARENSTRMALFIDRLDKGDTPEVAAHFTNKILINYTLKTRFEREVAQRLFPFYMYTARNIPLQFEYLLKKPGVMAGVQKLREEFAGDQPLGVDGAQLPDFLAKGLPIRMGTGEGGVPQFGRIAGQLGISDLNAPFDALNRARSMINPFLSTPLEMASNRDFFSGDKLEHYPGQSRNFLGVPMSTRWALPPTEMVRALSELNRANPGNVFGTKDSGPAWNPELPREFNQPSGGMRLANILFGRTYSIDEGSAMARTQFARDQRIRELEMLLDRAQSDGERDRIIREIDAVASGEKPVQL
jgi:hypothetical protein